MVVKVLQIIIKVFIAVNYINRINFDVTAIVFIINSSVLMVNLKLKPIIMIEDIIVVVTTITTTANTTIAVITTITTITNITNITNTVTVTKTIIIQIQTTITITTINFNFVKITLNINVRLIIRNQYNCKKNQI